jgi:hypothetical protein
MRSRSAGPIMSRYIPARHITSSRRVDSTQEHTIALEVELGMGGNMQQRPYAPDAESRARTFVWFFHLGCTRFELSDGYSTPRPSPAMAALRVEKDECICNNLQRGSQRRGG